jgi:hypothetical protein
VADGRARAVGLGAALSGTRRPRPPPRGNRPPCALIGRGPHPDGSLSILATQRRPQLVGSRPRSATSPPARTLPLPGLEAERVPSNRWNRGGRCNAARIPSREESFCVRYCRARSAVADPGGIDAASQDWERDGVGRRARRGARPGPDGGCVRQASRNLREPSGWGPLRHENTRGNVSPGRKATPVGWPGAQRRDRRPAPSRPIPSG